MYIRPSFLSFGQISYLRKAVFHTNFSTTDPEDLISSEIQG